VTSEESSEKRLPRIEAPDRARTVTGQVSQKVIIRAIVPSLSVSGKMADPTLELRDGDGVVGGERQLGR
jgi:hypothetical protein